MAKAELTDMGESTDDLADSTSKLRSQLKALTGVDIMLDENTFKSTAQIIKEIGAEWYKLTDVSKASTLEIIAGKTRASTVSGLIENYKTIDEVIKVAEDSAGSARKENERYLDSIEGRLNLLTSQTQEFWTKVIDSEVIKEGITLLTKLLELATDLVDVVGVLPTILIGIAGAFSVKKNVGINTLVAYWPKNVLKYRHHRVSIGYDSLDYDKCEIHMINEGAICEENRKSHTTTLLQGN